MAQKKRYKVSLPSGEDIWFAGYTVSEAFLDGWEKYTNMTTKAALPPKCMTVKEFIEQKYKPAFFPTLKRTTK